MLLGMVSKSLHLARLRKDSEPTHVFLTTTVWTAVLTTVFLAVSMAGLDGRLGGRLATAVDGKGVSARTK